MRNRKRPGVVWLPATTDQAVGDSNSIAQVFQIDISGPSGTTIVGVAPQILDIPAAAGVAGEASLADFEQSAYRLRRIVGKVFVAKAQTDPDTFGPPKSVLCTGGFIILRVDQNGNPVNGSTDARYNPQLADSERDPWIWRRSWILGNAFNAVPGSTTIPGGDLWPKNNSEYGSVQDGPHVDAKTARIVRDEERLFFCGAAMALDGDAQNIVGIRWVTEVRVLGSMLRTAGNRRNASR